MNILLFFIILIVLIIVHEFGHFIVAKRSGIRVDEFGIGFPPRALTFWKRGDTIYTLNWIPFGGFVKIFGENPDEESINGKDREKSFVHKPKVIQVLVLVAGVFFNVLLAWFIFFIVFMIGTTTLLTEEERTRVTDEQFQIVHVAPNSPAENVGLTLGDEILAISAGNEVVEDPNTENVTAFIGKHPNEVISITVSRAEKTEVVEVTPVTGLIEGDLERSAVGIGMGFVGTRSLPPHLALWEATTFTGSMFINIAVALFGFFASAFTLSADLSQVTGPVGIVGLVGDAASVGVTSVLIFTAFISLNLAVINLIPFPALDGGRILFVIIEAIKGSPIQPKIANTLNTLGFALLILLMLAVTYSDIARIVA